jgi:hypothetical protein
MNNTSEEYGTQCTTGVPEGEEKREKELEKKLKHTVSKI